MRWIAAGLATAWLVGCGGLISAPPAAERGHWIAAWASAQLTPQAPAAAASAPGALRPDPVVWQQPLAGVTLRQQVRVTAGGSALRVRLSNVLGRTPLRVGAASIALVLPPAQGGAPLTALPLFKPGTLRALTFGGRRDLTLPAGAQAWSDAVPISVERFDDLAVQMHIVQAGVPATAHPGARVPSFAWAGDHVDAEVWSAGYAGEGWWFLDAIDVQAERPQPVLAVLGDSITDGYGVPAGTHQRWTDALARRIAAAGHTAAVVNTGIGGGRLLRDGLGPNALSRFERDVLERSGVTHAVVLIGVNDLGAHHRGKSPTPQERASLLQEMRDGYTRLAQRAQARGVCLFGATVLPYGGSQYYKPLAEYNADRTALNDWMRNSGVFDAVIDFDALARDPARPSHLRADMDIGDGLHPSMAGYKIMADAVPLELLDRSCPARAAPPAPDASPPAASAPAQPTAKAAVMPQTFDNPVISGFASDPSVCRSGDDYYLVTSSFEYFPGLPIHHSRDLVHWRLVGHALARESQLSFPGRRASMAIFAPTIRCEAGRFYIVTTDVGGIGNFLITARDPAGPWSAPIRLPEPEFGMDPSLFFDDDGSVYYTRHGGGREGAIYQARIDVQAGKLLEEPRLIWKGMGGIWPEGPHLCKRNGWYYLMIAEGGTSYDHRITMGRSRSPWGPFEAHPDNPILTHRGRRAEPFQALGHADLVVTPAGDWWATLLAIRPQAANGGRHHHIGRETLLAPVHWRADDWPEIGQGRVLPQPQPTAGLPGWAPWPAEPTRETFSAERPLAAHWNFLRTAVRDRWSLTARPGHLRLIGASVGLEQTGPVAFVGRRQEQLQQRLATQIEFEPAGAGDAAGVALRQNETHHVLLHVTGVGARRVECVRHDASGAKVIATSPAPPGALRLQVLADAQNYRLEWRSATAAPDVWQTLCTVPTHALSTETAGGFVGVYLGLYAVSPSTALSAADFAWVDFETLRP